MTSSASSLPSPLRPPARLRDRRRVEPGRAPPRSWSRACPGPFGSWLPPPDEPGRLRARRGRRVARSGGASRGRRCWPRAVERWPVSVVTRVVGSSSSARAGRGPRAPTPGAPTTSSSWSGPTGPSTKPSTRGADPPRAPRSWPLVSRVLPPSQISLRLEDEGAEPFTPSARSSTCARFGARPRPAAGTTSASAGSSSPAKWSTPRAGDARGAPRLRS